MSIRDLKDHRVIHRESVSRWKKYYKYKPTEERIVNRETIESVHRVRQYSGLSCRNCEYYKTKYCYKVFEPPR